MKPTAHYFHLLARPKTRVPSWWPHGKDGKPEWARLDNDGGWLLASMVGAADSFPMTEREAARAIKEWKMEHVGRWDFDLQEEKKEGRA